MASISKLSPSYTIDANKIWEAEMKEERAAADAKYSKPSQSVEDKDIKEFMEKAEKSAPVASPSPSISAPSQPSPQSKPQSQPQAQSLPPSQPESDQKSIGLDKLGDFMQNAMSQNMNASITHQYGLRAKYESYPKWYQNSVYPSEETMLIRDGEDFEVKIEKAKSVKDEGSRLLKDGGEGSLEEAEHMYEQALSIFKYATNTEIEEGVGVRDDTIVEYAYTPKNANEKTQMNEFMKACLLNLSLVYMKSVDCNNSILACTEVLNHYDNNSSKAYYRRALAIITPTSAGGVEFEKAVKDLKEALRIDPNDKVIKNKLSAVRAEMKSQGKKDKATFGNLFTRGDISSKEDDVNAAKSKQMDKDKEKTFEDTCEDDLEVDKKLWDCEQVYKMYVEQERWEEAAEMRNELDRTYEARVGHDKRKKIREERKIRDEGFAKKDDDEEKAPEKKDVLEPVEKEAAIEAKKKAPEKKAAKKEPVVKKVEEPKEVAEPLPKAPEATKEAKSKEQAEGEEKSQIPKSPPPPSISPDGRLKRDAFAAKQKVSFDSAVKEPETLSSTATKSGMSTEKAVAVATNRAFSFGSTSSRRVFVVMAVMFLFSLWKIYGRGLRKGVSNILVNLALVVEGGSENEL